MGYTRWGHRRHAAARRIQRTFRRRRGVGGLGKKVTRLAKTVRKLKTGVQHKHLTNYLNVAGISANKLNQPVYEFTSLPGEDSGSTNPTASLRDNQKILLKSVKARINIYPDALNRADYYQFKVMLILVPDTRNINNADNFQLQNFQDYQGTAAPNSFQFVHAPLKSILNFPDTATDAGMTRYKVIHQRTYTMRTTLGNANNAAAMNNSPLTINVGYKWKKGLSVAYVNESQFSAYRNNVILHIVPSNTGGLGAARPSIDMMCTVRWDEV